MQYLDSLRHLLRKHPDRLVYLRRYPANATWRGWLPQRAISELELAGNTVQRVGNRYLLNATGDNVQATLRGTICPIEEVA